MVVTIKGHTDPECPSCKAKLQQLAQYINDGTYNLYLKIGTDEKGNIHISEVEESPDLLLQTTDIILDEIKH